MTKKDYRAIGNVITSVVNSFHLSGDVEEVLANAVADVFAADNPRFDRERFLRFVETGVDKPMSQPTEKQFPARR